MRLVVITDILTQHRFSHRELVQLAIRGGADTIQLREKHMKTQQLLAITQEISQWCKEAKVRFIVNDRVDIAFLCDADGIHLGQDDLPISSARKILGSQKTIGGTAATLEQALEVERQGADYVGFGHVFPTSSKVKTGSPKGVSELKRVCQALKIPVVAIGGIHLGNIKSVMEAGPGGIAVCGAVCRADNPEIATKTLKDYLNLSSQKIPLVSKF